MMRTRGDSGHIYPMTGTRVTISSNPIGPPTQISEHRNYVSRRLNTTGTETPFADFDHCTLDNESLPQTTTLPLFPGSSPIRRA